MLISLLVPLNYPCRTQVAALSCPHSTVHTLRACGLADPTSSSVPLANLLPLWEDRRPSAGHIVTEGSATVSQSAGAAGESLTLQPDLHRASATASYLPSSSSCRLSLLSRIGLYGVGAARQERLLPGQSARSYYFRLGP